MGDIRADVKTADIIVASVPTLGRRASSSSLLHDSINESSVDSISSRLRGLDPALFKCIIIDEAHHSAAPSYRRIMEHFGAFDENSHLLVWGCSATFRRFDDRPLDLFQRVTYHIDLPTLMRDGWLCRAEVFQVSTDFILDARVAGREGDFSVEDLSLALNTENRNKFIAQTWMEKALLGKGKRIMSKKGTESDASISFF